MARIYDEAIAITTLPLCGACENRADPRAYHRHPMTGVPVMLCDGCVCWPPYNEPKYIKEIDASIIKIEKIRAMIKVIES